MEDQFSPEFPSLSRRDFLRLGGGLGAGLLAAACAPAPVPSPTAPAAKAPAPTAAAPQPTAPAKPKTLVKYKYGTFSPNLQDTPFLVGIEKGFFAEQGIEIEPTFLNSDVTAMQGLVGGEFDFISLNLLGEVGLIAGGATMKIVGSSAVGLNQVTVARKEIKSVKELAGKSVGTSGPGSLPDIVADLILKQNGVDPSQVTKVNAGATPARLQAVLAGKIDATQVTLDDVPKIQADGQLNVLSINLEDLKNYVIAGMALREQTLKEKPDQVVGLLVGTLKGIRFIYANPAETVKIMAEKLKRTEAETKPAFDLYLKYNVWAKNLDLTAEQLDYMQGVSINAGKQKEKLPIDRIADFSFREKALAAVGKV